MSLVHSNFCWAWDSTILLWCQKNSFLSNFLKVLFYETYLILPCLQSLKRQVAPRLGRWNLFAGKMNFSTGFVTSGARSIICSILRENPETRSWICILVWRQWTRKRAGQGGRTGTNMIIMWAKNANTNMNLKYKNEFENCKYKYKYEFDFAIRKLWFESHYIDYFYSCRI